jgi:hypothetical protein
MRFWTRELAGWLLLGLSLYVFYRSYAFLTDENHHVLEGGTLTVIGLFLFRGGIQLLRVAVAAQVCAEAQQRLERHDGKPSGLRVSTRGGSANRR